jgi:hypothetical protein
MRVNPDATYTPIGVPMFRFLLCIQKWSLPSPSGAALDRSCGVFQLADTFAYGPKPLRTAHIAAWVRSDTFSLLYIFRRCVFSVLRLT